MEFKFKFETLEELEDWFNFCCTRCAMRNLECGNDDQCSHCRANWVYEEKEKELKKERRK